MTFPSVDLRMHIEILFVAIKRHDYFHELGKAIYNEDESKKMSNSKNPK